MAEVAARRKKILVIDDEGALLNLLKIRLENSGYEVIPLGSGVHAIDVASQKKPDVILLDMVMPVKSGSEVCKELKANEATRGIPVIVFTAHYPEETALESTLDLMGADDYILKPFDPPELLGKIKRLVKQA